MSPEVYQRALEAAVKEYECTLTDRAALDTRIAQLQQTIGTLNKLCGHTPTLAFGLTDACRLVLKSAHGPVTAVEIRDRLRAFGFDLDKYVNALAGIHTVLKRLEEAGDVARLDDAESARFTYQFVGSRMIASYVPPAERPGRGPAAGWVMPRPTGVGLCPAKDQPKLARVAKTGRPGVKPTRP